METYFRVGQQYPEVYETRITEVGLLNPIYPESRQVAKLQQKTRREGVFTEAQELGLGTQEIGVSRPFTMTGCLCLHVKFKSSRLGRTRASSCLPRFSLCRWQSSRDASVPRGGLGGQLLG